MVLLSYSYYVYIISHSKIPEDRIYSPTYLLKNTICSKNNSYYLLRPYQFLSNQFSVLSFIYSISFNTHDNAMEKISSF